MKRVLPTKVNQSKLPKLEFNVSEMVTNYFVIFGVLQELDKIEDQSYDSDKSYFRGLKRGYEDWFEGLNLTPDLVRDVYGRLDLTKRTQIKETSLAMVGNLTSARDSKIVIPGVSPAEMLRIKQEVMKK